VEKQIIFRQLGLADYQTTWTAMRTFTDMRTVETVDELWLVEHPPVYTMGLKGRNGTATAISGIPVIYSDRGGDLTYHGPGQAILYVLIDIGRLGIGIKTLVQTLEQTILDHLAQYGIAAQRRDGAPGVYVDDRKIASLGLRMRRTYSYHGLAFNVNMDLYPFTLIDPCGYPGMQVAQLADLLSAEPPVVAEAAGLALAQRFAALLGYNAPVISPSTHLAANTSLHG
jgi:lipoyl(octanoyl) transferase